jgi:hypothetical protein
MQSELDGNAAAGILQAIFAFEVTLAEATCASCGTSNPLGRTAAFLSAMGTIVRCPSCDDALIRVALVRGQYVLDLRGVRTVRIGANPDAGRRSHGAKES